MIEITVSRRLGELNFQAQIQTHGRVLALCGPSGAGKTTLLNMAAGLLTPDEGRIAIGGMTLFDRAAGVDLPARRRRLGYVFQEPRLFPHLSAAANLRYGLRFASAEGELIGFDDVVDLLGVRALLARRPEKLSGGEKQRIAIGRALLSRPRALLLDEPLAAIDEARRTEILALIEKLRDAFAVPILFVSHRADEVARIADAIADVEPGRVTRARKA